MPEIVNLRSTPLVTDIPAQLRQMADMIEAGEVQARSALFIVPKENDWPDVFGWGEHLGGHGNIAVCEITKAWFIENTVDRNA